ncbi:MAG: ThiF family adenylyltransferase [Candidatus Izimaplasma sp.]|nr:ThiF family adenylyltransferase [Candidatus Izimaplasma bacterium]
MKVPIRYKMNMGVLNKQDLIKIQQKDVIIIGLGGLGGNVVNQLVRLGVNRMTIVDFDCFEESNLNRQLFSNMKNIGKYKVDVISKEIKKINPQVTIRIIKKRIQNVKHISGDYMIDCVDNIETKIYLSKLSNQLQIPLLHGSCGGWYGQVGWISPKCTLIEDLYGSEEKGLENELLIPSYVANVVASYMVSEFIKMIKNSSTIILDNILFIDLYENIIIRLGDNKHG